jgi:uncharacterized protein YjbJ (UPF0337 family)
MNWDDIEGDRKPLGEDVRQQWRKLTDSQPGLIAAKRDPLAGWVREAYGISKGETKEMTVSSAKTPERTGTGQVKGGKSERELSDRDAEQRWETEGGILDGPTARSDVNIPIRPKETAMQTATWMRTSVMVVSAAVAAMTLGCSPQPPVVVPTINDKIYSVTPASVKVKAGIVSGEVTEMKVTERVEEGSGRIASPARLTGKLVLKNISPDQTVRLLTGKIFYIDAQGHPIKLGDNRTEPTVRVASSYGSSDRLDPGQDTTQAVDADFPVEALKAKKLKEIRLELAYIPSPFKEETLNFTVSIGGQ